MQDGFEDVRLSWQGETWTVPAERVFELVRRIETILMDGGGVPAFVLLLQKRVPFGTLAQAYTEALRFAGAEVTGSQVYLSIMDDFASNQSAAAEKVQNAIVGLMMIISPPMAAEIIGAGEADGDPKK